MQTVARYWFDQLNAWGAAQVHSPPSPVPPSVTLEPRTSRTELRDELTLIALLVTVIVLFVATWKLSGVVFKLYSFALDMCYITLRVTVAVTLTVVCVFYVATDEVRREASELCSALLSAFDLSQLTSLIGRFVASLLEFKMVNPSMSKVDDDSL